MINKHKLVLKKNIMRPATTRVKGHTRFVGKSVRRRRKRFQPYKVYRPCSSYHFRKIHTD